MANPLPLLCVLMLAGPADEAVLNRPIPARLTGEQFAKALEKNLSGDWHHLDLRTFLKQLADENQTAVLLDRGIDPNQALDLELNFQPLAAGFQAAAKTAGAEFCILGNVVYFGPANRALKLRTLEQIRAAELSAIKTRLPKGRALELARSQTVHWNDLDEPRQFVVAVAAKAGVKIVNPEAVPHDLWATATLPKATMTEALSLILIQFDFTFTWNADASEIRLVPVPQIITVEKAYLPAGAPSKRASRAVWEHFLNTAAKTIERQLPGASCRVDAANHRVLLSATLEQHESLSGTNRNSFQGKPAAGKPLPIRRRQFTFRVENVPAIDLFKKLEESGIEIQYDPAQLAAKKIDLNAFIKLDVKQATGEEFFKALCDPLGLKFTIDQNVTVTLTPK